MIKYSWELRRIKNKKRRTKNRTLRNTKWEKGNSRMKVVYRNYRTLVEEVKKSI